MPLIGVYLAVLANTSCIPMFSASSKSVFNCKTNSVVQRYDLVFNLIWTFKVLWVIFFYPAFLFVSMLRLVVSEEWMNLIIHKSPFTMFWTVVCETRQDCCIWGKKKPNEVRIFWIHLRNRVKGLRVSRWDGPVVSWALVLRLSHTHVAQRLH